jgi:hypothetical protein
VKVRKIQSRYRWYGQFWQWISALGMVFIMLVVLPLLVMAAIALVNDRVYGDWTCMFANCVKVKP